MLDIYIKGIDYRHYLMKMSIKRINKAYLFLQPSFDHIYLPRVPIILAMTVCKILISNCLYLKLI